MVASSVGSSIVQEFGHPSSVQIATDEFSAELVDRVRSSWVSICDYFFMSLSGRSPLSGELLTLPRVSIDNILGSYRVTHDGFTHGYSFFTEATTSYFSQTFFSFSGTETRSPEVSDEVLFSGKSENVSPVAVPAAPCAVLLLQATECERFTLRDIPIISPTHLLFFGARPTATFSFSRVRSSGFSSIARGVYNMSGASPSTGWGAVSFPGDLVD